MYLEVKKNFPQGTIKSKSNSKHGNANGILDAIHAAFEEDGIIDWKEKLVGFGSDGAAVNVGSRNGVAALLQKG
ncbi:unnamed protein product [Boreogadus saida]